MTETYFRTKGISTKSENPNLQAHAIIKLADNAWLPFKRQSSYDQFTFHYHRLKFWWNNISVDGIILWLLIWVVNYVAMLLVVCQLSRDFIGYEDS